MLWSVLLSFLSLAKICPRAISFRIGFKIRYLGSSFFRALSLPFLPFFSRLFLLLSFFLPFFSFHPLLPFSPPFPSLFPVLFFPSLPFLSLAVLLFFPFPSLRFLPSYPLLLLLPIPFPSTLLF